MDGFHLADVQLDRLGRGDRKGAPDTFDVDGYVAALRRLHDEPDRTLFAPGFERDLEQPLAAAIAIPPSARLVVTEGNYLLLPDDGWERVRPLLTEVWFTEVDDDVRRARLVRRHEQFGKSPEAARAWVEQVDEPNARAGGRDPRLGGPRRAALVSGRVASAETEPAGTTQRKMRPMTARRRLALALASALCLTACEGARRATTGPPCSATRRVATTSASSSWTAPTVR